jgi:hypothetical protein
MSVESSEISITVSTPPLEYYYLYIAVDKKTGYIGDTFTISGNFRIVYEAIEQGLAGKKIELLSMGPGATAFTVLSSTTTDSYGNFTFKFTPTVAGSYRIKTRGYI